MNRILGQGPANLGDSRRMYIFLLLLTVAGAVGLQGWRSLLNNFMVESAGLNGFQNGVVQSVREVPGFLSLLVIYLLLIVSEHKLAAFSILILGAGVVATGFFPTFGGLIITTLILSFGFHYFETLNQSLTLQYFDRGTSPLVFGRLKAVGSVVNLAVGGAVWIMASYWDYPAMFALMGVIVFLLGAVCLFMNPVREELPPQKKRMVFKKKYWLFYALTFFSGSRRQVFVAFAVFLLVKKFEYSVQGVTALFVINNLVNTYLSPLIGRAINHFGERKVLSLEYSALFFVFLGYAVVDSPVMAGVLYVLDHVFFNFAIAIRTYFQKIAEPSDIAPSMAVGFTINHIAAVVVPVLGGAVWLLDYRMVFVAAAVLSLGSLVLAQWVGRDVVEPDTAD